MQLIVTLGATVGIQLDGHSATDGAPIAANTVINLSSNDTTVATVPPQFPSPTADSTTLGPLPLVTILATGSTDIAFDAAAPDGTPYSGVANLVVNPLPTPGLVSISITLVDMTPKA